MKNRLNLEAKEIVRRLFVMFQVSDYGWTRVVTDCKKKVVHL